MWWGKREGVGERPWGRGTAGSDASCLQRHPDLGPLEADPETRILGQMVSLGGHPRKHKEERKSISGKTVEGA